MLLIDEKYLLLSELDQWECLHYCCSTQSRDANLWKFKIWRLSLLHPPRPRISIINPPPPRHKHFSIHPLIGWVNYMKSYMRYKTITINVYDCNGEIIFVSDKLRAKMLQKPNFESKEIRILGENEINSKLKHTKAHNSILSGRFGDSYGWGVLSYPGELACMIIDHTWQLIVFNSKVQT